MIDIILFTHICLILIKCWKEEGIGPEMLFESIWNLLSFNNDPNSSGKVPDNILPFNNL